MIRLLLISLLLTGCAYNFKVEFHPPYTDHELRQAEYLVKEVRYVPWSELGKLCGSRSHIGGCVTPERIVYILEDLTNQANYDVYYHEVGHLRDVHIEGVSYEDTSEHKNWPRHRVGRRK